MPSTDITYCAGTTGCAKRMWCRRSFVHMPDTVRLVSIAALHKDYNKEMDFCPHFWEYREEG